MIPSDQQGMSPTRTATLDGEVSGPNYDTAQPPPGLTRDDAGQGSEKMMNGAGPEPPRSSTAAEDRTLPQPSGSAAVSGVSDFLSAPSSATDRDRAPEAQPPPEALTSSERDVNVFSATAPRVEVGSYEFSPPEDLPEPRSTAEVNSQPFWFAKIGEFVQRRVAQAGAAMTPILESGPRRPMLRQVLTPPPRSQRLFTPEAEQTMSQWTRRAPHLYTPEQRTPHQEGSSNGSLTQEQVLAEVQKQVKFEMRVHEEERQLLAQENRQLKDMLERVLNEVQARGLEGAGRTDVGGTSQGPQGSGHVGGCGGNPGGLPQPPDVIGGYPPVPNPAPEAHEPQDGAGGCSLGSQRGLGVSGGDPLGVRAGHEGAIPGLVGNGSGGANLLNEPGVTSVPRQQQTTANMPTGSPEYYLGIPYKIL